MAHTRTRLVNLRLERRPRGWAVLGCVLALTTCRLASAATGRVVVTRVDNADPVLSEAVVRIQGELTAEGFDVVVADAPSAGDTGANAASDGALATITLSVDEGADVIELRVVDRLTDKVVLRRTPLADVKAPRAAQTLAVRAVDLLRASLLELLLETREKQREPQPSLKAEAPQASQWAARRLQPAPRRELSVEAGAGALIGGGGIGPALLASARVRYVMVRPLSLRIGVAGLGTSPRVRAATGSARVAQDFATLEALAELPASALLSLTVSLGAGAMHVSAEGMADWPYVGRQQSRWAALFDASVGLRAHLSSRFELALETHALVAEPYPEVRFLDAGSVHADRPALFESLTLAGWL